MNEPRVATVPSSTLPAGSGTAPSASVPAHAGAAAVRVSSAELFAGALEVQIDHHGAVYRLKQTALGKLILTK